MERRQTFRILEVDGVGAALEAAPGRFHVIDFARRDELRAVLFQGEVATNELHGREAARCSYTLPAQLASQKG